jgi:hypothetical protein
MSSKMNAEGKYAHNDANVIRNVEVQGLSLDNEKETGREGALRGSSDGKVTRSYDIESLDKRDYSSLSLERLLIEENISNEEICKLLELLCKYQERFV